jgi:hypothetical protein
MPALSERDMRVLAFERRTFRTVGAKEKDISEALGMSATRYYQLLNELIDTSEALQFDPSLVKRLRAQRAGGPGGPGRDPRRPVHRTDRLRLRRDPVANRARPGRCPGLPRGG